MMRVILRRFAVALTVILALTFLLVGSSLVSARAKQTLTGIAPQTVRWTDGGIRLERKNYTARALPASREPLFARD